MKSLEKQNLVVFVLILTLAFSALFASVPFVKAETRSTRAFIAVNPSTIGVSQYFEVTVWLEPIPPAATDVFHGFQVTITKPDGTTENRGPLSSSPIGSQYFTYTPTLVGKYSVKFNYPGETFAASGIIYSASESPSITVTAQQEALQSYPENPLPTGYWDRPINAMNRNWWLISGNWLQRGYSAECGAWDSAHGYNPYSQAPRAPHVMWTKELTLGGLVGGEFGSTSYYAGLSYEPKLTPPIIMNGRLYYNLRAGYFGPPALPGFVCVDLTTGEEIWRNNDYLISNGQLYNFISANQMGVTPFLWNIGLFTYELFDANTGDLILTFANSAFTSDFSTGKVVYGEDGTMFVYLLEGRFGWFAKWNSTKAFEGNGMIAQQESGLQQFVPARGVFDWRKGLEWNKTIPILSVTTPAYGQSFPGVAGISGDVLIATAGGVTESRLHVAYSTKTGEQLWSNERAINGRQTPIWMAYGEGIYVQWEPIGMQWIAYDLNTGKEKWVSDAAQFPWGTYLGNTGAQIAKGKVLSVNYDGYLHAYDVQTGKELWKFYSGDAGTETPYGTWPMYYGPIVAGGVVYVATGEHSPTQPLIRGQKVFAVDIETGKELWRMEGQMVLQAIADGYLVGYNAYDNRVYCFGKGPSATEVSVSPAVIGSGASTLISGKVTDQSLGQPGTPAIADKDMGVWMGYLKQQQSLPTIVTGVPVKLSAHSSSGSTIEIGSVTSDGNGNFEYLWKPATAGTYKIIATFEGSDSYGSSAAETAVGVSEQAEASSTGQSGFSTVDIALIVMVIIAILIGFVNLMILRGKK